MTLCFEVEKPILLKCLKLYSTFFFDFGDFDLKFYSCDIYGLRQVIYQQMTVFVNDHTVQ